MACRGHYPFRCNPSSEREVTSLRSHSKSVVELDFTSVFASVETFALTSPLAPSSHLQKDRTGVYPCLQLSADDHRSL